MAQDDYQTSTEAGCGEFDTADLRRSHDIASDSDHEQVAETLIEDQLRRNARVRAAKNYCKWLLSAHKLGRTRWNRKNASRFLVGSEAPVSIAQPIESMNGVNHGEARISISDH